MVSATNRSMRFQLCICFAIGLVLNLCTLGYLPTTRAAASSAVAATEVLPVPAMLATSLDPPDPCDLNSWSVDAQPFIDVACQIHTAVFTQGTPAAVFGTLKAMDGTGTYHVTTHAGGGGAATLTVVHASKLNVKVDATALYDAGVEEMHVVVGHLKGPTGGMARASWLATTFNPPNAASPVYTLIPLSIVSQAEYDIHMQAQRLTAGARFVDSQTGKSYTMDDTLPGPILAAMAHETDLATVYCTFGTGITGVDEECVRYRYEQYNNALDAAKRNLEACLSIATAAYAALLALCSLAAFGTGPAVVFAFAICLAHATIGFDAAVLGCRWIYNNALATARQTLLTELRRCGLNIYEI